MGTDKHLIASLTAAEYCTEVTKYLVDISMRAALFHESQFTLEHSSHQVVYGRRSVHDIKSHEAQWMFQSQHRYTLIG